jgi:hypothetical protein
VVRVQRQRPDPIRHPGGGEGAGAKSARLRREAAAVKFGGRPVKGGFVGADPDYAALLERAVVGKSGPVPLRRCFHAGDQTPDLVVTESGVWFPTWEGSGILSDTGAGFSEPAEKTESPGYDRPSLWAFSRWA